jgi:hypothetical protein
LVYAEWRAQNLNQIFQWCVVEGHGEYLIKTSTVNIITIWTNTIINVPGMIPNMEITLGSPIIPVQRVKVSVSKFMARGLTSARSRSTVDEND